MTYDASIRAGQEDARFFALVLTSLRANGAGTVEDLMARFPEEHPARVAKAARALRDDGSAWVKKSDDGFVYIAERGEGFPCFTFDEREFVDFAWRASRARLPIEVPSRYAGILKALREGPRATRSICSACGGLASVVAALQALRALGWIVYDGERWARKEGLFEDVIQETRRGVVLSWTLYPVGAKRAEEAVSIPAAPTAKAAPSSERRADGYPRIYRIGEKIEPPEEWRRTPYTASEHTARRIYDALKRLGELRGRALATETGLSFSRVSVAARYLAGLGILTVRRGGLPGDGCDACSYVFGIGSAGLERLAETRPVCDASARSARWSPVRAAVEEFLRRMRKGRSTLEVAAACGLSQAAAYRALDRLATLGIARRCGNTASRGDSGATCKLWKMDEVYRATGARY